MMAIYLIIGFFLGSWYTAKYHRPVLPVKVTKLPPDNTDTPAYTSWSDNVEVLVRKCTVGAHFGGGVQFNQAGAKALADLLKTMGTKLDRAVELHLASKPNED